MPTEIKKEIELEIAHVLFIDIVGYSKLSVNEQHARVDELNGIVTIIKRGSQHRQWPVERFQMLLEVKSTGPRFQRLAPGHGGAYRRA